MRDITKKFIFFGFEILMNVISIIIIPKASHYKRDNLYNLFIQKYYNNYQYYISSYLYDLEEELSSPRKTSVAILVFALILAFIE